jgi:hypothetical protein
MTSPTSSTPAPSTSDQYNTPDQYSGPDQTRAKLFCAVRDGAILHVDKEAKEAYLDPSGEPKEMVPYRAAAKWVAHLDQMAEQARTKREDRGAAPSTELSRIVVVDQSGSPELLAHRHGPLN